MQSADQYIDAVKDLPPAPIVATKLLDLFSDPDRDIHRVVELIRHDPSLTGKVLNRCNSAHFSGALPATDIFEVVTRLGFHEVYNTVVALVTASTFTRLKTFGGMDLNKLWRHSVISAVAAGAIAKRVDEPQAVAFTAGLLHDIGKLILASVEDSHYAELVRLHGVCHLKLDRAEQEVFGVEHAALGAELLARWGLPDTIVAAVRHHHSASSSVAAPGRLVAIIKLANNLAHFLSIDAAQMCDTTRCNPNALPLLGLTDKELPELIQQIDDGLRHVQGFSKLTFNQFNQSN